MSDVQELFVPKPITATTVLVAAGLHCALGGVFCSTVTAAPTLEVQDAQGTQVVAPFVLSPGVYSPLPCRLANGLKLVITGVASLTAFYLN